MRSKASHLEIWWSRERSANRVGTATIVPALYRVSRDEMTAGLMSTDRPRITAVLNRMLPKAVPAITPLRP